MAFHARLRHGARVDLIGIYHWISEDSPDRADRWVRGLQERIETLKLFPHRCPIAPEGRALGRPVRLLTYGKNRQSRYRILFEVTPNGVDILAIRHTSRRGEPL